MTSRLDAPCSKCGSPNDAQSAPEDPDALPEPGNFSICLYCGLVTVFARDADGSLYLREMTKREAKKVAADPGMQEMERARQAVMAQRAGS